MTYQPDFTLPTELLEQITSQGLDFIPELVRILVNAAMRAEPENFLGAELYQHSNQRQGHANSYKLKTHPDAPARYYFAIPQVPVGGFHPQPQEKGHRSVRVLTTSLALSGHPRLIIPSIEIIGFAFLTIYLLLPAINWLEILITKC